MRLGRWIPAILLGLLVALPAFPPLSEYLLREGLKAANFRGQWQAVGGYLLAGLELRGVRLEGQGITLEAQRLRVGYNLLSLLRRELPLRIWAQEGEVFLRWEALIPERHEPGPPSPFRLRIDELVLDRVGVQIEESQKFFLPTLRAVVRGTGPYQVRLELPDGKLSATVWRTGREFEAWRIEAKGDLRAGRYWFDGLEAGELEGTWIVGPKVKNGILGRNQVKDATVKLVGFTLDQVAGSVDFDGKVVTARLKARGLEGPLRGEGTVNLSQQYYRFRVEGTPRLSALAEHFGLRLPVSGGGPLWLEGQGWQNLVLRGQYRGEGRLLGEPLRYQGTLGFDHRFRLDTQVEGAFFDRNYQANVALRGDGYTVALRDSLGSQLRLEGRGAQTQAEGSLVWPRPLLGQAGLRFASQGARWQLGVRSEGVGLPLAKPFSLSGSLVGEGPRVQGRLGGVVLSGTWDDLGLGLEPLALVVGQLTGQARLRDGRFSGELQYDSPYARFPIALRQEGGAWRLFNRWAQGVYQGGVFTLGVRELPIQALEAFRLSGQVRYAEGGLSGGWRLESERVRLRGELFGLATRYQGEVRTPLRVLSMRGVADAAGLQAQLETLRIIADAEGLRLQGPLALGPQIALEADLGLQGGRYLGQVRFQSPWLQGWLEGRGAMLWAEAQGYARLAGPLWPNLDLKGRLTLPFSGPLKVPEVPLEVDRRGVRWPGGQVAFQAGLPFSGTLPLQVNRAPASLTAQGDLERGRLELRTPYGVLGGEGAWRNLPLQGRLAYAGYTGALQGQADLLGLAYQGRLQVPRLEGGVTFRGQGTRLDFLGQFQQGRLALAGGYADGLRLRAVANGFDLSGLGLPGRLWGRWSEQGGRLEWKSPYGQAQLSGDGLLGPLKVQVESPYGAMSGSAGPEGLAIRGRLDLPYLEGALEVAGPWGRLEARGQGRYRLPYLEARPWRLWAEAPTQTWRLEGPLALEGRGLAYRGRLDWPYRLLEQQGVLQGHLEGEALRLEAQLYTDLAGLPLEARLQAEGASLEGLRATLSLPGGQVHLAEARLVFDLETAPLARLFNLGLEGRLQGRLSLAGLWGPDGVAWPEGEAAGALRLYGQPLELDYKDRSLSAFFPQYRAGVVLAWAPGQPARLSGMGELEGHLEVGPELAGGLAYRRGGLELEAQVGGALGQPTLAVQAHSPWATLEARGQYVLSKGQGEAQLTLQSPYAQARLNLLSQGLGYQASGWLESQQYLRQGGALRLEGEGARWRLAWAAPLRLEAGGQAAELESLLLAGRGVFELAQRPLALSGQMALVGQDFRGRMQLLGEQVALELLGQGEDLALRGQVFQADLEARTNRQGLLSGQARYTLGLGPSRLEAQAVLSGHLWEPSLEGQGHLVGQGAGVALRFGYRWGGLPWAQAEGAGVSAWLRDGVLALRVDSDLQPFTGLPFRLQTQGQGPWEGLRLPLRLYGQGLEASGQLYPAGLELKLAGRYEQQRFTLAYQQGLEVRLEGPYAQGTARWVGGAPQGRLALNLPLPQGGLVGEADLAEGEVRLEGQGGWQGRLRAWLAQGWARPTRWSLEAGLASPWAGAFLEGRFDLEVAPLSLEGAGRLDLPGWGSLALRAQGGEVVVEGQEGLEPLSLRVQLNPLRVGWAYAGALPRGLGRLEAQGVYPGRWAVGRYEVAGQSLNLEGRESQLRLSAPGLQARLGLEGLEARLENYTLSGLRLSGRLGGAWGGLEGVLRWEALGRSGTLEAAWRQSQLRARLEGDLAGELGYAGGWRGRLALREGFLEFSGPTAPVVEGELLGQRVRLDYPMLQVAGLELNLAERSASGELALKGLTLQGQGPVLEAAYPLAEGHLVAGLDLRSLVVELRAPELGSGALRWRQGMLEGALRLSVFGLDWLLEGAGSQLRVQMNHSETPWLPWGQGGLQGQLNLEGAWRLAYQDSETRQRLEAQGRLLEARLEAQGPWLQGQMRYSGQGDWQGRLHLEAPLEPLDSRLQLTFEGQQALRAQGVLTGDLGRLELEGRLGREGLEARAGFRDLALEEVPQVQRGLPFLRGRASGLLTLDQGRLAFDLQSPGLRVQGDDLALATHLRGRYQRGAWQAELDLERSEKGRLGQNGALGSNRTTARLRLENGHLSGEAVAASFPLHWLLSAWAGELAGQAYWTGRTTFHIDLQDPWASKGVWVGEYLRFQGGGDTLVGQAALRFERERLYIDQLALSGKGTWSGQGYYGRRGSNLRLNLENTSFTPVLRVIPNLKPLTPEGSGTVRLSSSGEVFDLTLEDFSFRLGPVRGQTPRAVLRVGESTSAEGRLQLFAPYPAQAELSGEGDLSRFVVRARGTADLPLLSANEPFVLTFGYPAYTLDARLERQNARLAGIVFPQLILALQGQVPVSYPRYYLLEGLLDTNLFLRYQRGAYIVQGSVDVVRARLGLPEGVREVSMAAPETTSGASPVPVEFNNIRLKAERGILIQESLAQGELAGELYLNGDFSNPFLSGEVVPLRGSFKLWDRDFIIRDRSPEERSYARFSPADGILPELQIVADTVVQDRGQDNRRIQVNLTLKGAFLRQNGRIKVNLSPTFVARSNGDLARKSDGEPYTDAEIYALLLLGRSDLSALPTDIAQTGLQAAVQNFIVGQLERELARVLGLDQVKVEIPALSGGGLEETRFTIGRYLSPELFFAYSVDLRGFQTVFAEYQQGDFRFRFSTDIFPLPRPELSLGYTLRPGTELTFDLATGIGDGLRSDGVRFGLGFNFRF